MFSQTTEYALRAMALLAVRPDDLTPTTTIAELTKVPSNYLAKVLQQLSSAELITGRRGVGGGYRLARPPEQITLLEVVRAVTTLERIKTCPLGIKSHGTNLCPLHRRTDQAIAAVIAAYDGASLRDLIDQPGQNTPLCDTSRPQGVRLDIARRK